MSGSDVLILVGALALVLVIAAPGKCPDCGKKKCPGVVWASDCPVWRSKHR